MSKNNIRGKGLVGEVIDLSNPSFNGWPVSLAGEIYLAGSLEEGYYTRPNKPIAVLNAEIKAKRSKSPLGKLEARVEALEALMAP